jgi:hypothetical protein
MLVVQRARGLLPVYPALNDKFDKYTEKKWRNIDIGTPPDESVLED